MTCCVYWVRQSEHTDISQQGYVGVSTNVHKRFKSHKGMWAGTNNHLKNAIKRYGWDNLIKTVVLVADKEYCLNIETKLRPKDKVGWNLTVGGGYPPTITGPRPELKGRTAWNKGKTGLLSDATLLLMSEKRRGISPVNKGVPHTDATKVKISKALKGRVSPLKGVKRPQEIVDRIAQKNRGRVQSVEERAMRSLILKGIPKSKPMTDEHKRKVGLNSVGKNWFTDGSTSVFCLPAYKPDNFVSGRLMPWIKKKGNRIV